jgi:hypothetical protein
MQLVDGDLITVMDNNDLFHAKAVVGATLKVTLFGKPCIYYDRTYD